MWVIYKIFFMRYIDYKNKLKIIIGYKIMDVVNEYSYIAGVYVFLLGCLMFTWDSLSTNIKNKKYISGCILFDVGCIFFAIDAHIN